MDEDNWSDCEGDWLDCEEDWSFSKPEVKESFLDNVSSFKTFSLDNVKTLLEQMIKEISLKYEITESASITFLMHFSWNKDKLIESLDSNFTKVTEEIGVTSILREIIDTGGIRIDEVVPTC